MSKNRRVDLKNLNKDYSGKCVQFSIKTTIGRKIQTINLNDIIKSINEDKSGYFVINLSKDCNYIKLTYKEANFFDKYEKIGKFIIESDETFKELTNKLRKI
jgi:hypothetical protein